MEKPPLRLEEVRRILARLEPLAEGQQIVLVGGQAVAVWTEFFKERGLELALVTSKDIDFEGSSNAAKRAGQFLQADRVQIPRFGEATPNTGVVYFVDSDGVEREMDFIREPKGLAAEDVQDSAIRWLIRGPENGREIPVWVMHPERCMESRIHNTIDLDRTDDAAMEQLGVSIVCAREWSRHLLKADEKPERERVRAVLALNERVAKKCLTDQAFRLVNFRYGEDPFDAVLLDDELPRQFVKRRYPQLRDRLIRQRERDRERWGRQGGHTSV